MTGDEFDKLKVTLKVSIRKSRERAC